jgi:type II restriction/modification system DNA methylase subunit YeeA
MATINEFVARWRGSKLSERAAAQSHFIDLCQALGVSTPSETDQEGDTYVFEKGVAKTGGGSGFADVWYRGHFAWEYKKKHADLVKAYDQLLKYREDLENPPLLVVCDLYRFEIHTNFTNTAKRVIAFTLDDLDQPATIATLRALFNAPESLRPQTTPQMVTEDAAKRFGELAGRLHARGEDPARVAHGLMQVLFCLFAEDIGRLPGNLATRVFESGIRYPDAANNDLRALLGTMASGGVFWGVGIPRFNGGLFERIDPPALASQDFATLHAAAKLNWSSVEPAIFGTLFERSLDPRQRAQLGAHYTGRSDIMRVVDPVVATPLRRRWQEMRAQMEEKAAEAASAKTPQIRRNRQAELATLLSGFQAELVDVRVLDPACGSGNFLYLALATLLDLEQEALKFAADQGLTVGFPTVSPRQMLGLEINSYARELAQVVIWIGYLQWMHEHGYRGISEPILDPLETIRLQDALLDRSDPEHPKQAEWPDADFIIGNPPFLGGNKIRKELGDDYVEDLFDVFKGRVPAFADLCCYFMETSREKIKVRCAMRSGLLATNSIRGGANREVLKRIKETGDIFLAWSDEPWILDGADVRISIVGFDDGSERERALDGLVVSSINSDLTSRVDVTSASTLEENQNLGFMGFSKKGPFDISSNLAKEWLALPLNANGKQNSDVVKRWWNGRSVTRRWDNSWIVDFGVGTPLEMAAYYEAPFQYILNTVKPIRDLNNREIYRTRWWIHAEPRPKLRDAIQHLSRFIVTPTVSKHRLFVWLERDVVPDQQLIAFAREDDYFFGVLHSRAHEVWSLRMGTWLGVGNDPRYTPTTCFETFPLPWTPGKEPVDNPSVRAIAAAAKDLDEKRNAWLNPPDASDAELKKRTLTNLYNQRPTWLAMLHDRLDRAVWAAYGWDDPNPAEVEEETILSRLLELNRERSESQ